MSWNLEGHRVSGLYLGTIPVEGVVTLSRVKYGGAVAHYVDLDEPVEVYGSLRSHVTLEESELVWS